MKNETRYGIGAIAAAALAAALVTSALGAHTLHAQQGKESEGDKKMAKAIDAAIAAPKLAGARVGVHVVDLETGEELYARDAGSKYNPASNQKLLTGACALDVLGPQHTFTTRVEVSGRKGESADALYVRGGAEGLLFERHLLEWAAEVRARGIREIKGDVVVVEDAFAGQDLPPGFEQKQEPGAYRAPIGALSVNLNAATVTVRPTSAGKPAEIQLDPPNRWVELVNETKTGSGSRARIGVYSAAETDGRTKITVRGSIGADAGAFKTNRRIDDPAKFAGSALVSALETVGVEVGGKVVRGKAPASTETIVEHTSEPLSYMVQTMNKFSSNFIAELLLRALGTTEGAGAKRGSWAGGVEVLRECATRLGVHDAGSLGILNGSGLYTGNEISPKQITSILTAMHAHKWAPEYTSSLPIAGVDGTLAKRFDGSAAKGTLRAKTGTLNQVTALSGYATTKAGKRVAFSILINDPPTMAWRLRPEQDAIADAIVGE